MSEPLEAFLAAIPRFQSKRAKITLETLTRRNGGAEIMKRHELIERIIDQGGRVEMFKGEWILATAGRTWLDTRSITQTGMDYAKFYGRYIQPV